MVPKDLTIQEEYVAEVLSDMGLRYEMQYPIGNYIVDFLIPELAYTVVEADGVYGHFKKADEVRDRILIEENGIGRVVHVSATSKEKIKLILQQELCPE